MVNIFVGSIGFGGTGVFVAQREASRSTTIVMEECPICHVHGCTTEHTGVPTRLRVGDWFDIIDESHMMKPSRISDYPSINIKYSLGPVNMKMPYHIWEQQERNRHKLSKPGRKKKKR